MSDSKVTVYTHTHTLTITCTCCHDVIKGTQDLKIYSHADSQILSTDPVWYFWQMDAMSFDKEAATKALSRAEEAHRLERGALDEQLSRSRKFNDNLNDQLAQNELLLARSESKGTEAKMVSRSERQVRL